MRNYSYATPADSRSFALVGAPRIWQVRAGVGTTEAYMDAITPSRHTNQPNDPLPFGGPDGQAYTFTESLDAISHYSFEFGVFYPTGGYLLPAELLDGYLQDPVHESSPGTEFYNFPHHLVNTSALQQSGWIDAKTMAIFHDFTIYSSQMDAFCVVRLAVERGMLHGTLLPSFGMRMVWLPDMKSSSGLTDNMMELVFMVMGEHADPPIACAPIATNRPRLWPLAVVRTADSQQLWITAADKLWLIAAVCPCAVGLLIFSEIAEFAKCYLEPEQPMSERLVLLRYQLRLKALEHAALRGVIQYRPQRVLNMLSKRLFVRYNGTDGPSRVGKGKGGGGKSEAAAVVSRQHVKDLNELGKQVNVLHRQVLRMRAAGHTMGEPGRTEKAESERQRQSSLAVEGPTIPHVSFIASIPR